MSLLFAAPLKLNQNQLQNGVFHVLSSPPSGGVVGQFYWDSTSLSLRTYDGTSWNLKATDSALLNGSNAAFYLSRANHTGSQSSTTISDLSTTVHAYTLDSFAAPVGNVNMAGFTLSSLNVNPSASGQAAEYSWVLNQISSAIAGGVKAVKDPVRALFSGNQTLSGIPTSANADGLTLSSGDRVLLTGQSTASQNGIWLVAAGAWSRPKDYSSSTGVGYAGVEAGTEILVNEGTTYGGSIWRVTTTGNITVDTTSTSFSQVNKVNTYTAGNGLSLTGTVFAATPAASGGILVGSGGISVDRSLVPNRYGQTIGDGSTTSFTITHNLATQDVMVAIREISSNSLIYPDVIISTVNSITVTFTGYTPSSGGVRVTVLG